MQATFAAASNRIEGLQPPFLMESSSLTHPSSIRGALVALAGWKHSRPPPPIHQPLFEKRQHFAFQPFVYFSSCILLCLESRPYVTIVRCRPAASKTGQ